MGKMNKNPHGGGQRGTRTRDPLLNRQPLYQLS